MLFVAVAATSWGVGGFVAAILHRIGGPGLIAVSFWRNLGGIVLLAALRPLVRRGRPWSASPRQLIATGVGFAVYQTAYYVAVPLAGLAVATMISLGLAPVLILIGARVFYGERPGARGLAVVVVALVGLVLLTADGSGTGSLSGIGLSVLSATGYAAVTLLRRDGDPYDTALGGSGVAALCLFPLALAQGLWGGREVLGESLALMLFLAAGPTALAYALFFTGLTAIRATTAALVSLVEPLTAAVLAVLVLHEHLRAAAAVGGLLLLGALALRAIQETRAG